MYSLPLALTNNSSYEVTGSSLLNSSSFSKNEEKNVTICVRMRPFGEIEKGKELGYAFEILDNKTIRENISLSGGKGKTSNFFLFDNVFGPSSSNAEIYDACARKIVDSCLQGYNGVVFAYGQTSSGKTHSVLGYKDPGLISRAMSHIFDYINNSNKEWLLRVTYVEIYNEHIYDLFNPKTNTATLIVQEDKWGQTIIKNIEEKYVTSEKEVLQYIYKAQKNRHTGETGMNKESSRSHAVFTMIIESKDKETDRHDGGTFSSVKKPLREQKGQAVRVSTLFLVDLAGSEKSSKSKKEGHTRTEGNYINTSLLALNKVILQLSKNSSSKAQQLPSYRESKLTRILKIGLGGNSKLSVLCCITPGISHLFESISTLRFGYSASKITNNTKINEVLDETALLKCYKREIDDLRKKLENNDQAKENAIIKQEIEQVMKERKQLEEMLDELTTLVLVGKGEELKNKLLESKRKSLCLLTPPKTKLEISESISPSTINTSVDSSPSQIATNLGQENDLQTTKINELEEQIKEYQQRLEEEMIAREETEERWLDLYKQTVKFQNKARELEFCKQELQEELRKSNSMANKWKEEAHHLSNLFNQTIQCDNNNIESNHNLQIIQLLKQEIKALQDKVEFLTDSTKTKTPSSYTMDKFLVASPRMNL
ncbi:hypothetical protein ABK040_009115 [Willaertia magna]